MTPTSFVREAARDAALALRMLTRRPGFAGVALTTLALGIGAPTAIFSVVNAVLLRPLPYLHSERVVAFTVDAQTPAGPFTFDALPVSGALDWNERGRTLQELAIYNDRALTLQTTEGPFRLTGISATPNLFDLLGAAPTAGRVFAGDEADRHQIVLSHATWRRYFHADPGVINTAITLDGEPYRVTGVMPAGFRFPTPEAAFWIPQDIDAGGSRGMVLPAIARLRDDATVAAVEQEGAQFLGDPGDPRIQQTLHARTLQEQMVGGTRSALWVLMAAVSLVSVIATMNIALLLLTRGATRSREFAIRLALGAARGRLSLQLFIEGLTLAVAGGAIGVALAAAGLRLLLSLAPANLPRLQDTTVDGSVLLFATGLTLVASVVFGVLSAGRVIAFDGLRRLAGPATESRLVATAPSRRRLSGFAAAELALTMVLLVAAGVLLESFVSLALVPQGFEPRGAVAFEVHLPEARYPGADARMAFIDRLREEVAHMSGVTAAGVAAELPNREPTGRFAFAADRAALTGDPMTMPVYETRMVSEDFIEAMGVHLIQGRTFSAADRIGTEPVIVISAQLARQQFPDRDPVGATLYSDSGDRRVVGVVADVRPAREGAELVPAAYLPLRQSVDLLAWHAGMHVVVRGGRPASLSSPLRALVLSLDPAMPPSQMRPLADDVAQVVAGPRFIASVLALFAAVALIMAGVGVYGVLAHVAGQRTREIGVRVALGATRRQIMQLMMGDGLAIVAIGLGAGALLAMWSVRALMHVLHDVTAVDPRAMASVAVLLAATGLCAAWVPARRAARLPVLTALRDE